MIAAASAAGRAGIEKEWCARAPGLAAFFAALDADTRAWRIASTPTSLEVACEDTRPEGPRGVQARIVRHEGGQLAAYFFRTGAAAGATYGYGGQAFAAAAMRADQAAAWAAYLVSGFDQAAAPRGLKRGFQFPPPA